MELDRAALDRWITSEPEEFDDQVVCPTCGSVMTVVDIRNGQTMDCDGLVHVGDPVPYDQTIRELCGLPDDATYREEWTQCGEHGEHDPHREIVTTIYSYRCQPVEAGGCGRTIEIEEP